MLTSFYTEKELLEFGFKQYGTNVLISRYCNIYGAKNISIGNNVRIDDFCILSGKITIFNNVHIAAYTALFGATEGIIMKDFSGLSSRIVIYASSDDYSGEGLTNPTVPTEFRRPHGGSVILEKHVVIGSGSTILTNVTIGEGASIGAMSLVNKDIEAWTINVGIPCKKVKMRSKNLLKLEKEYLLSNNEENERSK